MKKCILLLLLVSCGYPPNEDVVIKKEKTDKGGIIHFLHSPQAEAEDEWIFEFIDVGDRRDKFLIREERSRNGRGGWTVKYTIFGEKQ